MQVDLPWLKTELQNTIKNQMSTGSFFDDHKDKKELKLENCKHYMIVKNIR